MKKLLIYFLNISIIFLFSCLKADFDKKDDVELASTTITLILPENQIMPKDATAYLTPEDILGQIVGGIKQVDISVDNTIICELDPEISNIEISVFDNSTNKEIFIGEAIVSLDPDIKNQIEVELKEGSSISEECMDLAVDQISSTVSHVEFSQSISLNVNVTNTSTDNKTVFYEIESTVGFVSIESGELDGSSLSFTWTAPDELIDSGRSTITVHFGFAKDSRCKSITKDVTFGDEEYMDAKLYIDFDIICDQISEDPTLRKFDDESNIENTIGLLNPICVDSGLEFDCGDGCEYIPEVIVEDNKNLIFENAFTVQFYIKHYDDMNYFESASGDVLGVIPQVIFTKNGVNLFYKPEEKKYRLEILNSSGESYGEDFLSKELSSPYEWHLITVTFGTDSGRSSIKFYVDGILNSYITNQEIVIGRTSGYNLEIGWGPNDKGYNTGLFGIMQTFMYYDYEKTESEVAKDYEKFN